MLPSLALPVNHFLSGRQVFLSGAPNRRRFGEPCEFTNPAFPGQPFSFPLWNFLWLPWDLRRPETKIAPVKLEQPSIVVTMGHVRGKKVIYAGERFLSIPLFPGKNPDPEAQCAATAGARTWGCLKTPGGSRTVRLSARKNGEPDVRVEAALTSLAVTLSVSRL